MQKSFYELFETGDYNSLFSVLTKVSKSIIHKLIPSVDRDDLDDLSQDVLLVLWTRITENGIDDGRCLYKFLQSTCRRIIGNYINKTKRRNRIMAQYYNEIRDRYVRYIYHHGKETVIPKKRNRKNRKTIYVYSKIPFEYVGVFNSIREASRYTGADESNVGKILRSKENIKTAKGFYYSYTKMDKKPMRVCYKL